MSDFPLSLDDQWLHFVQHNAELFDRYPNMIPVRQELFKTLIAKTPSVSMTDRLKTTVRAFTRRAPSSIYNQVDVLFWLDSPRNVFIESLIPLYREMSDRGLSVGFAIRNTITTQIPEDIALAAVYRVRFPFRPQGVWAKAWKEFSAHNAASLKDKSAAKAQFFSIALIADANETEAEFVLKQVSPKVISLAADHYVPNSTLCQVARRLGIRSIVIQHGIVQAFYTPLTADEMILWGETSLDALTEIGVSPARLHKLGSPRYDELKYQHEPQVGKQFRSLLGLSEKPVFVFFSNGNDYIRNGKDTLEACAEWLEYAALMLMDEVQIVVRLHPNEDGRLYVNKQNLRVIKTECDSWLSMAGADAIGSLCSTALIEGLLYDKPILQFYAEGWRILADNWQKGLAERIANPEMLVEKLRNLSKISSHALAQRVFYGQGSASERIADFIVDSIR